MIMERLWLEDKKFITRKEIEKLARKLGKEYLDVVKYLLRKGYLVRIFRGIFYVKSLEELKLGKIEKNFFEILSEGLKLKDVNNWYFGLETALRLNNLTHEYFVLDTVINDKIFRAKPMKIGGHKIRFIKTKPNLIFGIKKKGATRFSDVEKTLLDFIYFGKYSSLKEREIYNKIKDITSFCDKKKIMFYAKRYPKSITSFLRKWKIVRNL